MLASFAEFCNLLL